MIVLVHDDEHVVDADAEQQKRQHVHQRREEKADVGAETVGRRDGHAHGDDTRERHGDARADAAFVPTREHERRVREDQPKRNL